MVVVVTLQYTGFVTSVKLITLVLLLVLTAFLISFTEELHIGPPGKT